MVVWGDVAYTRDVFFSPVYWRKYFKPIVKAIVDECHSNGIPVIYHGCGNVNRIFGDFVEIGVDAYNPLEAKAGLDVIDLRRRFGHTIGFCGNLDVVTWANGTQEEIKSMVLRKLNAAKGGGYIVQSDHSVPGNISGAILRLCRQSRPGIREVPPAAGAIRYPRSPLTRCAGRDRSAHFIRSILPVNA